MFLAILIWFTRIFVVAIAILALAPLLPTGAWFVRVWDFPRVQLLVLALLPLTAIGIHALLSRGVIVEHGILVLAVLCVAAWQALHVLPFTPLWPRELAHDSQAGVRLMVANVKYENRERRDLQRTIEQQNPDVLLLIEINEAWRKELEPLAQSYQYRTDVVREEGLGMALWSKLPTQDDEVRHLVSDQRPSIFATITLPNGNQARFVGIHPTPPGLKDETDGDRSDSRVRDAELMLVAREVSEDSDLPWIVAGDFNDVAWSHTTRLFKRTSGLRDPRVGRSLLNTYHAEYPPLRYPIDQLFVPEGSTIRSLERVYLPGSDHFAVVADMHVASREPQASASTGDRQEAGELIEEGHEQAEQEDVEAASGK